MKQQLQAYRQADTMGKSPLELVLMVYDGALKALQAAAEHFENEENQAGYDELQKAKRMVTHLFTSLDNEKGGQVAANLGKVYSWAIAQMQLSEATRDRRQIESVIQALKNLRAGWAELKSRSDRPINNAPVDKVGGEHRKTEHVITTA